ncbi:hypothetical protein V1478_013513 [Vespula squamosa]|uniref:Uncharacterized protein n=1 Tax=Vespula squamosa TaxID=30214 RepID=A0ABD2A677_VESSQ
MQKKSITHENEMRNRNIVHEDACTQRYELCKKGPTKRMYPLFILPTLLRWVCRGHNIHLFRYTFCSFKQQDMDLHMQTRKEISVLQNVLIRKRLILYNDGGFDIYIITFMPACERARELTPGSLEETLVLSKNKNNAVHHTIN